ncbi:MAG: 50S ribosomal protein L13 [Thermoproteota archaeon]
MSERVLVVDATDQVLGRMCSIVAKRLLEGYRVYVVNAEKTRVSGRKGSFTREYARFLDIKSVRSPKHTPRHPRNPVTYVRSVVKGMLPMNKPKGVEAFRRLRVYCGWPSSVKGEAARFKDADASRLGRRSFTLSDLGEVFKVPEAD